MASCRARQLGADDEGGAPAANLPWAAACPPRVGVGSSSPLENGRDGIDASRKISESPPPLVARFATSPEDLARRSMSRLSSSSPGDVMPPVGPSSTFRTDVESRRAAANVAVAQGAATDARSGGRSRWNRRTSEGGLPRVRPTTGPSTSMTPHNSSSPVAYRACCFPSQAAEVATRLQSSASFISSVASSSTPPGRIGSASLA